MTWLRWEWPGETFGASIFAQPFYRMPRLGTVVVTDAKEAVVEDNGVRRPMTDEERAKVDIRICHEEGYAWPPRVVEHRIDLGTDDYRDVTPEWMAAGRTRLQAAIDEAREKVWGKKFGGQK